MTTKERCQIQWCYLTDGTGGGIRSYKRDGKDNDKDGKIDEFDELFVTNEWGLYAQSQTKLNDKFELILASRLTFIAA